MHAARIPAVLLLAALGAACAPMRLAPTSLTGAPQGATFFADAVQELPLDPAPLVASEEPLPSRLGGSGGCGGHPGEQARAQCLRGEGWDTAAPPSD